METSQYVWQEEKGWIPRLESNQKAQLLLIFGTREILQKAELIDEIKVTFPNSDLIGCSTAGEISATKVLDDSLVLTVINFEKTTIKGHSLKIQNSHESYRIGKELATGIDHEGLQHVFVLSDGINVNGSELVKGITECLPEGITVTGGLSGDGDGFRETVVIWNSLAENNTIALIGFYGEGLLISYASLGGWDPFGPERLVTKSDGNILYELDGKSALELYKLYLGDYAQNLPASGLLFPLIVRLSNEDRGVVRTILSVDETTQSLIFAGDIPEGSYSRLMKANLNRLTDGAVEAAKTAMLGLGRDNPDLAILISCIGRKMIMKQQVEEEVEGVSDIFGKETRLCGFYSYGEISPFNSKAKCELHNQTMTITLFKEI